MDAVLAALPFINNIIYDHYLLRAHYEKWLDVGGPVRIRRKVIAKLKRLYRTIDGISSILHRLRYTINISHEIAADEALFTPMRQYRRAINCLTTFALSQARHKYEAFFAANYITFGEEERY